MKGSVPEIRNLIESPFIKDEANHKAGKGQQSLNLGNFHTLDIALRKEDTMKSKLETKPFLKNWLGSQASWQAGGAGCNVADAAQFHEVRFRQEGQTGVGCA